MSTLAIVLALTVGPIYIIGVRRQRIFDSGYRLALEHVAQMTRGPFACTQDEAIAKLRKELKR